MALLKQLTGLLHKPPCLRKTAKSQNRTTMCSQAEKKQKRENQAVPCAQVLKK